MTEPITADELAALLQEAAERHREAFIAADGVDPEWPLFYAAYVQAHLWDRGGRLATRSELVYLLVTAERAYEDAGGGGPWPPSYARLILEALAD